MLYYPIPVHVIPVSPNVILASRLGFICVSSTQSFQVDHLRFVQPVSRLEIMVSFIVLAAGSSAPRWTPDPHGLLILDPRLIESPYWIQKFVYLILGIEKKENSRPGKKEKVRGDYPKIKWGMKLRLLFMGKRSRQAGLSCPPSPWEDEEVYGEVLFPPPAFLPVKDGNSPAISDIRGRFLSAFP